jgi:hypothetical protein
MLFVDDETRHEFYKQPALLQVVCQFLESQLYNHAYQLHAFGCEQRDDWHSIMLSVEPMDDVEELNKPMILHIITEANKRFERKDGKLTVSPQHADLTLLVVRVSKATDLAQLI